MENSNLETATVNPMPRIGDIAPDFEAVTTKGKIKFSEFGVKNHRKVAKK